MLMGAVKAYLDIFEVLKCLFEATVAFATQTEEGVKARRSKELEDGDGAPAEGLYFVEVPMQQISEWIDKLDLSVLCVLAFNACAMFGNVVSFFRLLRYVAQRELLWVLLHRDSASVADTVTSLGTSTHTGCATSCEQWC